MIGDPTRCPQDCYECCLGPFDIDPDDAARLRQGFSILKAAEPARAACLERRVRTATEGDDDPCPALDPTTGRCDLYDYRPKTCRVFGTAVLHPGGAVTACEIIYPDASDDAIVVQADSITPDLEPTPGSPTTVIAALRSA